MKLKISLVFALFVLAFVCFDQAKTIIGQRNLIRAMRTDPNCMIDRQGIR